MVILQAVDSSLPPVVWFRAHTPPSVATSSPTSPTGSSSEGLSLDPQSIPSCNIVSSIDHHFHTLSHIFLISPHKCLRLIWQLTCKTNKNKMDPISSSHFQKINHQICHEHPCENPVRWAPSGPFCKYVLSTAGCRE